MTDHGPDPSGFRRTMARWPTGVAIVTSRDDGRDYGLTVNALLSVSLAPPSVLISLGTEADSTAVIERTGRFAASFLASDQRRLSEAFARTLAPEEKFRDVPVRRSPSGLAVMPGSVARLDCHVSAVHPALDHRHVIGTVEWIELGDDSPPLLFHRSGYAEDDGRGGLRLPIPKGP